MYWYKTKANCLPALIVLLSCLPSCRQDSDGIVSHKAFFDLKAFFKADTARLRKLDPLVNKTVTYNGVPETKKVHIKDWGSELGLFIESDINKPAWQQSYKVTATPAITIYQATDPTLRTREIMIKKEAGKVKWIVISNHTKNILYETTEKLSYFPDSVYLIQKMQRVKLIGTNHYNIKGSF